MASVNKGVARRRVGILIAITIGVLPLARCAQIPTRPQELLPIVEIEINNTPTQYDDYVSVVPDVVTQARIRVTNVGAASLPNDVDVVLANLDPCPGSCTGGQVLLGISSPPMANILPLTLPKSGTWVDFFIAGRPGYPSTFDKDAILEVTEDLLDGIVLARHALLVTQASGTGTAGPAVTFEIANSPSTLDDYVTWAPKAASVRLTNSSTALNVEIINAFSSSSSNPRGRLLFGLPTAGGALPPLSAMGSVLPLTLPEDGSPVRFYVAGEFSNPSLRDKDAVIEAQVSWGPIGRMAVMVRIRKDANTLTTSERDRFLWAVFNLNAHADYETFQEVHKLVGSRAHSNGTLAPAFMPWHRIFILRLERELQAFDPSVALHYWRFDQPAPNVFTDAFMGVTQPGSSSVTFAATNPLNTWIINNQSGVIRSPEFSPSGSPSLSPVPLFCQPMTEADVLNIAPVFFYPSGQNRGFIAMEWLTHDQAHRAAGGGCSGSAGWLSNPSTAVQDPLFFLLNSNVDRLWAKWQLQNNRFDPFAGGAYIPFPGSTGTGQLLLDTMWPWNDPSAPGGPFPITQGKFLLPPEQPMPLNAIDYERSYYGVGNNYNQGLQAKEGLGFAYDDVPFGH